MSMGQRPVPNCGRVTLQMLNHFYCHPFHPSYLSNNFNAKNKEMAPLGNSSQDKGYRRVTRWPFTTNKICTVGNKKGSNYLGETGQD